jgi:hypothetical protein
MTGYDLFAHGIVAFPPLIVSAIIIGVCLRTSGPQRRNAWLIAAFAALYAVAGMVQSAASAYAHYLLVSSPVQSVQSASFLGTLALQVLYAVPLPLFVVAVTFVAFRLPLPAKGH